MLSFLDRKSICAAKATSRLFRTLLYSTHFVINSSKIDWFDVTAHLQKYYNTTLVGLDIKSFRVPHEHLLEHISNLSALSAAVLHYPQRLRNLVQLKKLDFWTSEKYDLSELLYQLTNLRELFLRQSTMPSMVDVRQNTKLTLLTLWRGDASLSSLVKLRCLEVRYQAESGSYMTALTDLEKLSVTVKDEIEGGIISTINSTNLTNLFVCTEDRIKYDSLGKLTSLRELEVVERSIGWSSDASFSLNTLSNLTSLYLHMIEMGSLEQISTLTNLRYLQFVKRPQYIEDENDLYMNVSLSALKSLEHLDCYEIITPNLENDLIWMTRLTHLTYNANKDSNNYAFFETAPIQHFHNAFGAISTSPHFWQSVTKCTTLKSLRHRCGPLEDYVGTLTALSRLECLDLDFYGKITASHFTALTSLRSLLLFTHENGFDHEARDTLRDRMTWLKELNYRHNK